MTEFRSIAKTRTVGEGETAVFEWNGETVAIAHVDGSFYAFGDICTHAHCSLSEGDLEGTTVICPCHGSQFDLTTGAVLNPPATEPVPVYPVRVVDDEIQVEAR